MIIHTPEKTLINENVVKPTQRPVSDARGELLYKEKRLYRRLDIKEKVIFRYDKQMHSGESINFSPDGVSIISNKSLIPESNIIIDIYASLIKVDNTEKIKIITVEGEIIWVQHITDSLSKIGIGFKESNEELVRIYAAKLQDQNNHLNLS